jgi:uncharacterized protein
VTQPTAQPRVKRRSEIDIEFGGETLTLLAQKAVVWPREKTLFIADIHLGKAASFRAAGLAVPSGHSQDDIAQIEQLVLAHDIAHLVVLGDLVHNRASYTPSLDAAMRAFVMRLPRLKKTLVIGNHDSSAGHPPMEWGFQCIEDFLRLTPFHCLHEPKNWAINGKVTEKRPLLDETASCALAGHIHPAAWVRTAREAVNLPCFWQSRTQLVLPSFGKLTGRYIVEPHAVDVTYVVTGQQIFRNPTPLP